MTISTYEQRLAYVAEQEARPIFQTVSLLDDAYEASKEIASYAYDAQHIARNTWRTATVQKHDIAQIKQSIIDTQDLLFALVAKLEDAKASLALAVEAGE